MQSRSRWATHLLSGAVLVTAVPDCGRVGVELLDVPYRGADAGGGGAGLGPSPDGGAGGAAAGSGGATSGSAGVVAGSGGATAGSGGATAGSGGTTAGSAGAAAVGAVSGIGGEAGGRAGRGGASGTAGDAPLGGAGAAGGTAGSGGVGAVGGSAGWAGSAGTSGAGGTGPFGPDLRLTEGGVELECGLDRYDFAPVDVGTASAGIAFALSNDGDADLDLVGTPPIEIATADPSEFTVTALPTSPVAPGASTEFRVTFAPHLTGPRYATVVIASNDPDETPCRLALEGSGLPVGGPDNGAWQAASNLGTGRYGLGAAVSGGFLYVAGGYRQAIIQQIRDDVEYAPLNSDGTVGAFASTTSLPAATARVAMFAYNGYLFAAGGSIDTSGTPTDVVRVAPLLADGSVGTWTTTTSLPEPRRAARAVVHAGIVYLVGGRLSSGGANEVLLGRLGADGTVAAWEPTSSMLYDRLEHGVAVVNGRLYAIAGWDSGGVQQNEFAPINVDGTLGSWTETTGVPEARSSGTAFAYGDYVYTLAGDDGTTTGMHGDGIFAPVNPDGTLGAWSTLSNDFTPARTGGWALAYDNQMLVLGGWNQFLSNYDDVQRAPFP